MSDSSENVTDVSENMSDDSEAARANTSHLATKTYRRSATPE